jgi:tRNA1(Val) A37 N6-methylase TrmN6
MQQKADTAEPPQETFENLGPYGFIQKKKGVRLTQDTVLLAEFLLPLQETDSVIDLGTGSGAIPLVLAWKTGVSRIEGVEVDGAAALIAQRNIEANDLSSRISIIKKDFRDLPGLYPEGAFSIVVSNPPYVKAGSGRVSPVRERAVARGEVMGDLRDLVGVSSHLAGKDGRIFYVFPVLRLFELIDEMKKTGLKARRLKFIHTKPGNTARLFLIEAGRIGALKIEEPLFL